MRKKLDDKLLRVVALRLNALLLAKGLKDADIARMFKIKPQTWNNYTQGERPLPIPIALQLAERFGITLDWLYRGDTQAMPHGLLLSIQAHFQSAQRNFLN